MYHVIYVFIILVIAYYNGNEINRLKKLIEFKDIQLKDYIEYCELLEKGRWKNG